jgi:serine/threonine-protein kinase
MDSDDSAVIAPALPGGLAQRYTLVERLGGGSSAEVWLGRDELLGRSVAAKVLHRHLLLDAPARARFEREARAVARLAHPGIVPVYDVAADESGVVTILEHVPGWTLASTIRSHGALRPAEAARIAAEVAEALEHAHGKGVIHLDVKPGNVLIDESGRARLTDFGISRILGDEASRVTAAGTITGTLLYLAPEQLRGEDVDQRADIYGAGVVLFEMLTGQPAYRVTTPVALAEAHRRPLPDVPGASRVLTTIVRRAMAVDRSHRYQTAGALAHDLRGWLASGDAFVPSPSELTGSPGAAPTVASVAAPRVAPVGAAAGSAAAARSGAGTDGAPTVAYAPVAPDRAPLPGPAGPPRTTRPAARPGRARDASKPAALLAGGVIAGLAAFLVFTAFQGGGRAPSSPSGRPGVAAAPTRSPGRATPRATRSMTRVPSPVAPSTDPATPSEAATPSQAATASAVATPSAEAPPTEVAATDVAAPTGVAAFQAAMSELRDAVTDGLQGGTITSSAGEDLRSIIRETVEAVQDGDRDRALDRLNEFRAHVVEHRRERRIADQRTVMRLTSTARAVEATVP